MHRHTDDHGNGHGPRLRRRGIALGFVIAALVTTGLVTPSSAATDAAGDSTGVTAKEIKVGYIYSKGGLAGSTFENAAEGFNARIKAQNAAGGVNGRTISTEIADDSGSANNLVAAQDLVQNRKVFAVVNNSPFAFLSYKFLLDSGVPMVGGGYDGNEYGQPGNEKLISIVGNTSPAYGVQYSPGFTSLMKKAGAKNVGVVAYGSSASSTAAAENLQKYAVPAAGLKAAYTNTTVDFGTTDVGPLILGMKNAGVDAVYLPLVLSTNLAIVTAAAQNNLKFKLAVLATGYGQALLDQPASQTIGPEVLLATGWAPVELKTAATKKFQSDLTKYSNFRRCARLRRLHRIPRCRPPDQGSRGRRQEPHPRRLHHGHQGPEHVGRRRAHLPAGRRQRAGLRPGPEDLVRLFRADQEREVRAVPEQEPGEGQARRSEPQRVTTDKGDTDASDERDDDRHDGSQARRHQRRRARHALRADGDAGHVRPRRPAAELQGADRAGRVRAADAGVGPQLRCGATPSSCCATTSCSRPGSRCTWATSGRSSR